MSLDSEPAPAVSPQTVIATILNTTSLSAAVFLNGHGLCRLLMPAVWTAAALTMQVSPDGVTYGDVYDDQGNEYTMQAAAGHTIIMDPNKFPGLVYVKFRSGTGAVPVAQGQDSAIKLVVRPF